MRGELQHERRTAHAPALYAHSMSPKQANIYTWGWQKDARFRYAVCGRRFGKTYLGADEEMRHAPDNGNGCRSASRRLRGRTTACSGPTCRSTSTATVSMRPLPGTSRAPTSTSRPAAQVLDAGAMHMPVDLQTA